MPISSPASIRPISQEQFARIDYQVMRHAFDSQNELGRLCDEVIYQNDLAARLDLGGEETVLRMIPLARDGLRLGNQRSHMLASDMAFRLTALPDGADSYEPHLRALLRHSPLRAVQWINMSRHRIEFVTLTK
jgi:hypothetical protein